nr:PHO1spx/nLuc/HA fusion protein [Cloning vector OsPHO1pNFG]
MVKFSREYEASIIPEWKAAFVDYKRLKKLIKRIKVTRRDDSFAAANAAAAADHLLPPPPAEKEAGGYGFSILDPVRAIAARFSAGQQPSASEDEECPDRGELVRSTDKHEREFMERADEELEKVNAFYTGQEAELLARGDALLEQLRILADVKRILADHAAARRARGLARSRSMPPPPPSSSPPSSVHGSSGRYLLSGLSSPQSMSDGSLELQQAQVSEGAAVADEVMAALERNGVSFVGLAGKKDGKTKDGSGKGRGGGGGGGGGVLQLPATVRIDIPATSPGRAALKVWEELVNVLRKDGADPAAAFVHRKKIQHAEKNIRDAFMALYRGLELLKKFSSLNVKAFTKILKKFVKVSEQQRATDLFSGSGSGSMVFTLEDFVGDWRQTAGYNLDQVLEQGGVSSLFQNLGVSVTPIQRIVLSGENGLKIDIHVIIPYEGLSGDQMGQIEKIFKVVYPVDDHHFKVILHYGTLVIDGVTPNMIDYFGRPYEGIAVFDGKKITVTGTLWNGNKIIDERLINPDGSLLFRVTINGVTGWRLCERILAYPYDVPDYA